MKQSYIIAAAAIIPALAIAAWLSPIFFAIVMPPSSTPKAEEPKEEVVQPTEEQSAPVPQVAAEAAEDPYREITSREMTACWMFLKDQMNDPDSFKVLNKNRRNGGIVEFTAVNSFGGTIRQTYRCTTGELQ